MARFNPVFVFQKRTITTDGVPNQCAIRRPHQRIKRNTDIASAHYNDAAGARSLAQPDQLDRLHEEPGIVTF